MEEPRTSQDLITAGALIFFVLVAFIAFLYLNRKGRKGEQNAKTPNAKTAPVEGETGTVFIKEDDGRVVRRSTRQHKPVTPLGPRLAAVAADSSGERDVDTPVRASRTPRASSSKAATAEAVTPRSTRRGRPPKAEA